MNRTTQKATRGQTKRHNQLLVLKTIYKAGQLSRADVARATLLTKATVSTAVIELIDEGLLEEVGQQPSNGGKPGTLLSVGDDSRCIIGIDLADSEFRGGVVDLRGKVFHQASIPVGGCSGDEALALVYDLLDTLRAATTEPVLGIGVGVPGLIDIHNGIVRHTVHQDWNHLPLRDLLQERYDPPVYVMNDSHAAAYGEYTFGQTADDAARNMIVLRVGPGVSAGIVLDGLPFYGDGYGAGEIGHTRIVPNGDLCLCGHTGCLETVVSRRVLLARAQEIAARKPESKLNQFVDSPAEINQTSIVIRALFADDDDVREMVEEMGEFLGLAVANLVGLLNIRQIRVAGRMSCCDESLLDPLRRVLAESAHPRLVEETEIGLASLGADGVVQGVAALILSYELGLV
jgi:N-acetylglucosamine repressor